MYESKIINKWDLAMKQVRKKHQEFTANYNKEKTMFLK